MLFLLENGPVFSRPPVAIVTIFIIVSAFYIKAVTYFMGKKCGISIKCCLALLYVETGRHQECWQDKKLIAIIIIKCVRNHEVTKRTPEIPCMGLHLATDELTHIRVRLSAQAGDSLKQCCPFNNGGELIVPLVGIADAEHHLPGFFQSLLFRGTGHPVELFYAFDEHSAQVLHDLIAFRFLNSLFSTSFDIQAIPIIRYIIYGFRHSPII